MTSIEIRAGALCKNPRLATGQALRVLCFLLGNMNRNNQSATTQAELTQALGLTASAAAKAIKTLAAEGVIEQLDHGYRVSRDYARTTTK